MRRAHGPWSFGVGGLRAATLLLLTLSLTLPAYDASAQFGKPKPPSPPATGQPRKPPPAGATKKPPAAPSASAPRPAPAPDPKEGCEKSGGEWIDGSCDTQKARRKEQRDACLEKGDQWNEATGECAPLPKAQREARRLECLAGGNQWHETTGECVPLPKARREAERQACLDKGDQWSESTGDCAPLQKRQREAERLECLSKGDRWNDVAAECRPFPVVCPPGFHEGRGKQCVSDHLTQRASAPGKPGCARGQRRVAGGGCVPEERRTAPPPIPGQEESPPWQAITIVTGGLLVLAGAGFGIATYDRREQLDAVCGDRSCPDSAKAIWDTANTYALWSTGLILSGAIVLGAGIWAFPSEPKGGGATSRGSGSGLSLGLGPGQAKAAWSF